VTPRPRRVSVIDFEDRNLTLFEHLAELRNRLIIVVVVVALTTAVSFAFLTQPAFEILLRPATEGNPNFELIYTEMTGFFGAYMKVALTTGVIIAMPVIVYEAMMFVAPGLTRQERRYLLILLPWITLSFIVGVVFAYYVFLPPAVQFLITFGSQIAKPQIRVSNYVDFVSSLLFWIGVIFETPLIIFFLAKIGVVTPVTLTRFRRPFWVIAFVIAALITPTFDPVNQTIVAVPIVILYEAGILLARIAVPRSQAGTGG
jgi:sec-independent protein translocase protein TatC